MALNGDSGLIVADAWGEERSDAVFKEGRPVIHTSRHVISKMPPSSFSKKPVVWYKTDWFIALSCLVGFVITCVLGTMQLGLVARDATMVATFLATQVALIQPSFLPFLAKVGRPWSMLAGACFMIMLADMESEEAFEAIDLNTLALLFGASLLSANLEACKIQRKFIESIAQDDPVTLLIKLGVISAVMSFFITNDGSSLIIAPVALRVLSKRSDLPKLPVMLAVSSAANIGSALLLNGNPQNILVDQYSGESLGFNQYMTYAIVPTAISMVINTAMLIFLIKKGYTFLCCCIRPPKQAAPNDTDMLVTSRSYGPTLGGPNDVEAHALLGHGRESVEDDDLDELEIKRYQKILSLSCVLMVVCFFIPSVRVSIGWVTSGISLLVTAMYPLFCNNRPAGKLLELVDYELLLMFTGLFVVTGGVVATGVMDKLWEAVKPHEVFDPTNFQDQIVFSLFVLILSNTVGNVPAVILLKNAVDQSANPTLSWKLLALISTLAGNFTLLGSAANVITAAAAQRAGVTLTYSGYLKFGVLSTLFCMVVGLVWTNIVQ